MTACFIDSDLEHDNFLNCDISQGSVVTHLSCGGIINKCFVANLLVNLSVKEFWKSVNIWRSYGQYYSGLFFNDSQCIYIFGGSCPWQNFARCKINFTSKSCVRLYWQRYCTALQQRASAKLCGVVQGMEFYGTFADGATYIWQGGRHVGHRPTF